MSVNIVFTQPLWAASFFFPLHKEYINGENKLYLKPWSNFCFINSPTDTHHNFQNRIFIFAINSPLNPIQDLKVC